MSSCTTCAAQFGVKFSRYQCLQCQKGHCVGHIIPSDQMKISPAVMQSVSGGGHGFCFDCILAIWGKDDEKIAAPVGILGRAKSSATRLWSQAKETIARQPGKLEALVVTDTCFEELNSARALAIFRNQTELEPERMEEDLKKFARIYAVSQGRTTERSISLLDVYQVMDWLRAHPLIPGFAHGLQWSTLESSPHHLALLTDAWRVAQSAIILSSPVPAAAALAYNVADRALDQMTGKSLASFGYASLKDKLGLNVNVKQALIYYFAGQFILQLLKRRDGHV